MQCSVYPYFYFINGPSNFHYGNSQQLGPLTRDHLRDDTDRKVFQDNEDPSTTTDPLDADTDDDGLADGEEDPKHNGRVDPGEKDPNRYNAKASAFMPLLLL